MAVRIPKKPVADLYGTVIDPTPWDVEIEKWRRAVRDPIPESPLPVYRDKDFDRPYYELVREIQELSKEADELRIRVASLESRLKQGYQENKKLRVEIKELKGSLKEEVLPDRVILI